MLELFLYSFQTVAQEFGIALYDVTALQVGGYDMAQAGLSFQESFLNSEMANFLKFIAAALSIIFLLFVFYLRARFGELMQKIHAAAEVAPSEPATGGPLQNRWEEVMRHIESIREGEWKYAVIEADKLVDDELKKYFPGETMGERLMNIDKTRLLTIDGLWEAHKIRNRLAHDVNYFLRHAEAVRAVKLYEQTLKELEAVR